jgi:hypothetical protein
MLVAALPAGYRFDQTITGPEPLEAKAFGGRMVLYWRQTGNEITMRWALAPLEGADVGSACDELSDRLASSSFFTDDPPPSAEMRQHWAEERPAPIPAPPPGRRSGPIERRTVILFLAANPIDTGRLGLDEEMRAIDRALRATDFRDRFEIEQQWAVRIGDLQEALLRHEPDIVHFSGHGTRVSEIVLQNESGAVQVVPQDALGRLFSVLRDNIRCVVLNACYSEPQAQAIADYIDCVVGMTTAVGDDAAIEFATAFYRALGFGRDVQTAFDLGTNQIALGDLPDADTPRLVAKRVKAADVSFVSSG